AAGRVQHALGLPGGAGGVKDEQRVFRVHALGLAGVGLAVDHGVVPAVARHLHVDCAAGVADYEHGLDGGGAGQLERGVDVGLQRYLLAAAQALVGGDDELGAAVADAVGDGIGGEAAEDHGVDR